MKTIKYISGTAMSLLALSIAGCGGGDGSSSSSSLSTGVYKDDTVDGVNYTCGSTTGITQEGGKFHYEAGDTCTFYITYTDSDNATKTITLSEVDTSTLTSETYFEKNEDAQTVLQTIGTIETNSNGLNVITITPEQVQNVIDIVGDDLAGDAAESLVSAMQSHTDEIDVVTDEERAAHILNTLLLDSSFLDVGDDDGTIYASFTFSDEEGDDGLVDTVTYVDQLGSEDGTASISLNDSEGTATLTTDDNTVYTLTYVRDEDNDLYYVEMTTSSATERLYPVTEKGAAESYLLSTILPNSSTMYLVEDGMSSPETWQYSDATTVTYDVSTPTVTLTYYDSTTTVTFTGFYEDYLTYTYTDVEGETTTTGSGRMYYDADTAQNYLDELNSDDSSDSTTTAFSLDMVSGKTLYTSDFYKLVFEDSNTPTVQIFNMLNSEEDDGETESYSVNNDGQLVIEGSDDIETLTLTGIGDNYYSIELMEGIELEELTVYSSLDALEDAMVDDALPTSVTDASNDSTNDTYAGFELLTLTAEESSDAEQIQITVTANGSIPDALAAAALDPDGNVSSNYTNYLWIEVNNSIEFGMSSSGDKYCVTDYWQDGEYVDGTSIDSYCTAEVSTDGKTVTLTIDAEQIPDNDYGYLTVSAEMGADYDDLDGSDEYDDYGYDRIVLAASWSYNTSFSFTADWLAGKTLYDVFSMAQYGGENPIEVDSGWEFDQLTFSADGSSLTLTNIDTGGSLGSSEYGSYIVTSEGYIEVTLFGDDGVADTEDDEVYYVKAFSKNASYVTTMSAETEDELTATTEHDGYEYFFLDYDSAIQFAEENPIE